MPYRTTMPLRDGNNKEAQMNDHESIQATGQSQGEPRTRARAEDKDYSSEF